MGESEWMEYLKEHAPELYAKATEDQQRWDKGHSTELSVINEALKKKYAEADKLRGFCGRVMTHSKEVDDISYIPAMVAAGLYAKDENGHFKPSELGEACLSAANGQREGGGR